MPFQKSFISLAEINTVNFSLKHGKRGDMSRSLNLATGGILCFVLFLVVTALVFSGITQGLDAQVALAINGSDLGGAPTALMLSASEYGREYFWIPVVAVLLIFGDQETKLLGIELAALFVVGIAFGEALKPLLYRARPYDTIAGINLRVPGDTDSSYPSGHALIVSIGAAFSLIKFGRTGSSKAIALLLTLEAVLVCYSRVYVGMHYPLDVVGGIVLGIGIVGVGLFVLERYLEPTLRRLSSSVARMLRNWGPLKL